MKKIKTAPDICEAVLFDMYNGYIAGVDEAGRGPLAGPVVACALILPTGCIIEGVNDSKTLSSRRRGVLAKAITSAAVAYSYGIVDVATIDKINIHHAALLAMAKAIRGLYEEDCFFAETGTFAKGGSYASRGLPKPKTMKSRMKPKIVLVDGKFPPPIDIPTIHLIKGDTHSHLIAAASILAKEARDEIMQSLHETYPQYGFDMHKGYGTNAHRAAIELHGICPEHRRSFRLR